MTDSLILAAILAGCAALVVIGVLLWRAQKAADPQAAVMADLHRARRFTCRQRNLRASGWRRGSLGGHVRRPGAERGAGGERGE